MKKVFPAIIVFFSFMTVSAQNNIPHKFKEQKLGATIEAVRVGGLVKLYILVNDIEQYVQIQIERGNEYNEFSGVKVIDIVKGKYRNNYIETEDRFPVSSKMECMYRLKATNSEGTIRIFAPIIITALTKYDSSITKKVVTEKRDTIKPVVKENILLVASPKLDTAKKISTNPSLNLTTKPAATIFPMPKFDTDTLTDVYGLSDNVPHQVFIFFKDPTVFKWNVTITSKLEGFNKQQFPEANLLTRGVLMDNGQFVYIKSFKNKESAVFYIKALKAKTEILSELQPNQYYLAAISTLNYSLLVTTKKINNYMRFYRANY